MYEKKLELLIDAGLKIRNARAALEYTVGELRPLRSGAKLNPVTLALENKVGWLNGPKSREVQTKFKKEYNKLNERDSELDEGVRLLKTDIELLESERRTPQISAAIESGLRMLKKGFAFSDDPLDFGTELYCITLFFASTMGKYQGVNNLVDNALFHAGKVVGHLEARGRQESDKQGERGSVKKKNRYSDEDLKRAFDNCDAKNAHDMYVEIDAFLTEDKNRTGDKRPIPSKSTILRWLKDTGLEKQLPK